MNINTDSRNAECYSNYLSENEVDNLTDFEESLNTYEDFLETLGFNFYTSEIN